MKIALVALFVVLAIVELCALVDGEPRSLWWARAIAAALSVSAAIVVVNLS